MWSSASGSRRSSAARLSTLLIRRCSTVRAFRLAAAASGRSPARRTSRGSFSWRCVFRSNRQRIAGNSNHRYSLEEMLSAELIALDNSFTVIMALLPNTCRTVNVSYHDVYGQSRYSNASRNQYPPPPVGRKGCQADEAVSHSLGGRFAGGI